jgi:hypothetical protein
VRRWKYQRPFASQGLVIVFTVCSRSVIASGTVVAARGHAIENPSTPLRRAFHPLPCANSPTVAQARSRKGARAGRRNGALPGSWLVTWGDGCARTSWDLTRRWRGPISPILAQPLTDCIRTSTIHERRNLTRYQPTPTRSELPPELRPPSEPPNHPARPSHRSRRYRPSPFRRRSQRRRGNLRMAPAEADSALPRRQA